MSNRRRRIRIPATGDPLFVLVETKDGWVIKIPALNGRDHLMILREEGAVSEHLSDEEDEGPGRNVHVGRITRETPRPAQEFYDQHVVDIRPDEVLYELSFDSFSAQGGPKPGNMPSKDLRVDESMIAEFRRVDLAVLPLVRRTTAGEAISRGFAGGFRRVGDENVVVLRLSNSRFIQLSLADFFQAGGETARVMGIGHLLERAKDRIRAKEKGAHWSGPSSRTGAAQGLGASERLAEVANEHLAARQRPPPPAEGGIG